MAANAYLTSNVVVRADGKEYSIGTGDLPVTVALTSPGGVDARRFDVANAATVTVWDAATSPAGSFILLVLLSNQSNVVVEFQGTAVADNHHFELLAGVPFILGSDDSLRYNAASYTGVADNFQKCLVRNSSGSAALIQVLIAE
jgi:hypothetical protein